MTVQEEYGQRVTNVGACAFVCNARARGARAFGAGAAPARVQGQRSSRAGPPPAGAAARARVPTWDPHTLSFRAPQCSWAWGSRC